MVGSVSSNLGEFDGRTNLVALAADTGNIIISNGKVEPLPEEFDPVAVVVNAEREQVAGVIAADKGANTKIREIVLGRNLHTSCHAITEPDVDDELTGDREAYMASVLARYRKSLLERTKHHLGTNFISPFLISIPFFNISLNKSVIPYRYLIFNIHIFNLCFYILHRIPL